MSGIGPDRLHLVEGFRIELIACLTRFREWYVAGTEADGAETLWYARFRSLCVTTTAYQAGEASTS